MRKFVLAALVAFAPATSFAFAPMDVGHQVREFSSATVMEVGGCKSHGKRCHTRNRVDIYQRNHADVDVQSRSRSRNDVFIDQRNRADVIINGARNDVYIQQSNDANVRIR